MVNKEAVIFTQHRYASESLFRTLRLGVPEMFASGVDWLARNCTFGSIAHLGIKIIGSELRASEYRVRTADLFDTRLLQQAVSSRALIAISAMDIGTDRVEKMLDFIDGRTNVLLGGYGNTASKERFAGRKKVTLIEGEGEEITMEAVRRIKNRSDKKDVLKRQIPWNMADFGNHPCFDQKYSCDDLPMFTRTPLKVIEASRGCTENCDFCPTAGQKPRVKPLDILFGEISKMKMKPWDILFFVDQNLMACSQGHLSEIFKFLNKREIKWIGEGTITHLLENEVLIKEMARGCLTFLVGVEDLFKSVRGSAVKNDLRKDFEQTALFLRKCRLPVVYSMIFGTDDQLEETFSSAARKVLETGVTVSAHIATPRPGTPFWDKIVHENRLVNKASIDRNMRTSVVHRPLHMTREELLIGFAEFQKEVYGVVEVTKRFSKNLFSNGLQYALSLLVTDAVYATSTWKYLKRYQQLLKRN